MPDRIYTGVIGYPVGHSLSPLIHNYWITRHGFDADYAALEILPGTLESSIGHMIEEGYAGFNVTIPYKQEIMALCDSVSDTAGLIGAVNTVVITENGHLKGMNTDSFGFVENIWKAMPHIDFSGRTALVLGAGGAARAVVHGLGRLGVTDIRITNRTRAKAEHIAATFPAQVVDWHERESAADGAALLVNTTALGMDGQEALSFNLTHLPDSAIVCDIVYKPLQTVLLQEAAARGNPVVTGIGMLLHQARPAFKAWFGVMPEVDGTLQEMVLEKAQ